MKTTDEILDILREFKKSEGEKYGIQELGLFGSAARREQNEESDIDVCMKPGLGIDYFTFLDIKERLECLFNTKVDLLTLHENLGKAFRTNVIRDAIFV